MWFFNKKNTAKKLNIIIIGAGEVGFNLAKRLSNEERQVVVIDTNEEALGKISENIDAQTLNGSGSDPLTLELAGMSNESILVAVTDSDEINILSCLFANHIAPKAQKIARIRNENFANYHTLFKGSALNIGMIVNTDQEVVHSVDRMLSLPGAVDVGEFAEGRIKMVAMVVENGPLLNQPLRQLESIVGVEAVLVAAISRNDTLIIPNGSTHIEQGDLVYFIYTEETSEDLLKAINCKKRTIEQALIIGGGNIGMRIAQFFESKKYYVKLIEKDRKRCEYLASHLEKTLILHGVGADPKLLTDENIDKADVVIAATGDEEYNILTCLLAKSLGAKETVAKINSSVYQKLSETVGVDHTINPRLAAVDTILRGMRQGKILSAMSLRGDDTEILELIALENSEITNTPIRELKMPEGVLFLAVIREDEVFIPKGGFIIKTQDRVLLLTTRKAMPELEKALASENQ
ncbi:Trk system potassium transporter TrkA [Desulfovibrio litoralis]|uniref:Trk system potassium uptake protein TrkA n=1 Tax=Desulfovibrio litoralis DSM 11393 TaxID=1121455 RepID=A0A1M7S842_9BACT|nr:Trk system potassium transporter TrkA [Desulfovibrio litoralis]SHN54578.1 trk system potassium uptake protein TrkA [Desulfovibrio litoralis DSM 11393]